MTTLAQIRPDPSLHSDGTVESLFAIPGMHCAGCIAKIEKGLADGGGVTGARVNFTAKRVTVVHRRSLTVPDIVALIARLGFEAQPILDPALSESGGESRDLLKALGARRRDHVEVDVAVA